MRGGGAARTAAAHEVRVLQHADVGCSARHRPPYHVLSFVERLRQLQQPLLHPAVQRFAAGRDLQQRGDEQLQVPKSRVTLPAADGGGVGGNARLVGDELGPVCSAQEAVEHVVEGRLERVAAGAGAGKAAGAKRRRGGAAHA